MVFKIIITYFTTYQDLDFIVYYQVLDLIHWFSVTGQVCPRGKILLKLKNVLSRIVINHENRIWYLITYNFFALKTLKLHINGLTNNKL